MTEMTPSEKRRIGCVLMGLALVVAALCLLLASCAAVPTSPDAMRPELGAPQGTLIFDSEQAEAKVATPVHWLEQQLVITAVVKGPPLVVFTCLFWHELKLGCVAADSSPRPPVLEAGTAKRAAMGAR